MRAEFTQEDLDSGYAYIILTQESGDAVSYEKGDSIAIGKPASQDWLCKCGNRQWKGEREALALAETPKEEGNSVTFLLQPAYVDSMEDGPYLVCLIGKNGKPKGSDLPFSAYDISWSEMEGTQALKDYQEEEAQRAAAEAEARRKEEERAKYEAAEAQRRAQEAAAQRQREEAEAQRQAEEAKKRQEEAAALRKAEEAAAQKKREEAEAQRAAEEAEARRKEEERAKHEAAEAQRQGAEEAAAKPREEEAAQLPVTTPVQEQRATDAKKSGKGFLIGIIIAVLLLGGGAGLMLYKTAPEKAAQEKTAQDLAEAQRRAQEAAAQKQREEEERADAKGRVAAFFSGSRTPEAAMRLAEELNAETPEQQDALFRLYYYAAEQGHPLGALRCAEALDPSKPAWGSIRKDGALAWEYYGKTADGQNARLQLQQWVQRAAENGDADAAKWLQEMR